ncbi:MAG TPA: DUF6092 family protein [Anaerolineales bacterium]|jgi:hypothetical protein|nr:DUF6092 family protein [Anaerolineales bacterium]
MTEHMVLTESEALQLVAHLTASAEISLIEPDLYGPFRLIDACSKLAGHVLQHDPGDRRDFWEGLKAEIDLKKIWLMSDRENFREFIKQMPAKVAQELISREVSK